MPVPHVARVLLPGTVCFGQLMTSGEEFIKGLVILSLQILVGIPAELTAGDHVAAPGRSVDGLSSRGPAGDQGIQVCAVLEEE